MNTKLLIFSIISILIIILTIIILLNREKINVKYAIVWIGIFGLLLLLLIVPKLLISITSFLGFTLPSNMIIVLFISILVFLNIIITIIVSNQNRKIRLLIQEISILKKEVIDNEKTNK